MAIDRVVLLSLVPSDRWADVSEIAVQLGATNSQVSAALADAIAEGVAIDTSGTTYRRCQSTPDMCAAPAATDPPRPVAARPAVPEQPAQIRTATSDRTARSTPAPFSRRLRELRVAAGLSQNKLARLARIDPAYVCRLEGRKADGQVSRQVVLSVASVFELDGPATDRLLFVAGLAPARDYQSLSEDLARRLATIEEALAGLDTAPSQPAAVRRVG